MRRCLGPCWTTSPRSAPRLVGGVAGSARSTGTRPTTSAAAAAISPDEGSRSASPAVDGVLDPAWASPVEGGALDPPSWPAAGGCGCAMTGTPSGSSPSLCWPARGCATTACPAPPTGRHGHPDRVPSPQGARSAGAGGWAAAGASVPNQPSASRSVPSAMRVA